MGLLRFQPIISASVYLILLESAFFFPKHSALIGVLLFLSVFISFFLLFRSSPTKIQALPILLLPIYSSASLILFALIIPISKSLAIFLLQSLFLVFALIYYYYNRRIFDRLFYPQRFSRQSLVFFSSYANLLSIYLAASAIFGLQNYIGTSIWLSILTIVALTSIASYQIFWASDYKRPARLFYASLIGLLFFELVWAISFLTLSHYILGLLVAIAYYAINGLSRLKIGQALNSSVIKTYLYLSLLSLIAVLVTARWM